MKHQLTLTSTGGRCGKKGQTFRKNYEQTNQKRHNMERN